MQQKRRKSLQIDKARSKQGQDSSSPKNHSFSFPGLESSCSASLASGLPFLVWWPSPPSSHAFACTHLIPRSWWRNDSFLALGLPARSVGSLGCSGFTAFFASFSCFAPELDGCPVGCFGCPCSGGLIPMPISESGSEAGRMNQFSKESDPWVSFPLRGFLSN